MWTCAECLLKNTDDHHRCGSCNWPRPIRPPYPVIATKDPCCDPECGKEIQPGQSYVPTHYGPVHIGCGSRRRRRSQTTSDDSPF